MKIYFNRQIKREAWGGGSHFITMLYEYLEKNNVKVTFNLEEDVDILMMFDPRPSREGVGINELVQFKKVHKKPIVQRINDTDIARHAYGLEKEPPWRVKTLLYANQFVDHTIFISKWVKNHYLELGYKLDGREDSVITNGCDKKIFYPNNSINQSDSKLKIITHHWSNNPMKGIDCYAYLDKLCKLDNSIEFTYLGRYAHDYYRPENTNLINPLYGIEVANVLRSHDVYITGARYEACGMHHIEAAACGLPIVYHKEGGAIPDICKDYGLEIENVEDIKNKIDFLKNRKNIESLRSKINYNLIDSNHTNELYLRVFESLLTTSGSHTTKNIS